MWLATTLVVCWLFVWVQLCFGWYGLRTIWDLAVLFLQIELHAQLLFDCNQRGLFLQRDLLFDAIYLSVIIDE